jgi:hypothetical protein
LGKALLRRGDNIDQIFDSLIDDSNKRIGGTK